MQRYSFLSLLQSEKPKFFQVIKTKFNKIANEVEQKLNKKQKVDEIKTKEEHKLALFDCDGGEEENNVCTPEYVKTAWAKGWVVYYSDYGYWRPMRRWSDDDIHKMLGSKD